MLKKFTNKKGFTLMEMLIVVAIIAVLVAIAIPTFSGALTKSKEAADVANIRAAYAEYQVKVINGEKDVTWAPPANLNYTATGSETHGYKLDGKKITYTATKLSDSNGDKTFEWTLSDAIT